MAKNKSDNLTYATAMKELQSIVGEMQNEAVDIDNLAEKVQRATYLINFCREKLRKIEDSINENLEPLEI